MFKLIFTLHVTVMCGLSQATVGTVQQPSAEQGQMPLPIKKSADIARRLQALNRSLETMPNEKAMSELEKFKQETNVVPNVSPAIVHRLLTDNYKRRLCELFRDPKRSGGDIAKLTGAALLPALGLGLNLIRTPYRHKIKYAKIKKEKFEYYNKQKVRNIRTLSKEIHRIIDNHEERLENFEEDASRRVFKLKFSVQNKFRLDGSQQGDDI